MKRPAYVIGAIALSIAVVFGFSLVNGGSVSADQKNEQKQKPQQKQEDKPKPKKPKKSKKPKPQPYPGSVQTETSCHVQGSAKRGKKVNFTFKVDADGNARPTGNVEIKVSRQSVVVRTFSKYYDGYGTEKTSLGSFSQPGQYQVNATYEPEPGSVYQSSSCGEQSFVVR